MTKEAARPKVSFIMAALDDERYLKAAVDSILASYPKIDSELILVLGPSSDGTRDLAAELCEEHGDDWMKMLFISIKSTPAALNMAIDRSSHEILIRVDAHSEIAPNYTSIATDLLALPERANVGGRMIAKGSTPFERAVACAYNSRFGLGGGRYHIGGEAGESKSVYLGCFSKAWLRKVGGFNPKWIRGQDWELNARLRAAGGVVWFEPSMEATYVPRGNAADLASQFRQTGFWRGQLTRTWPMESSLRYWIPPLLVLSLPLAIPVIAYLASIIIYSLTALTLPWAVRMRLMAVIPIMHFSWGIGFLQGIIKFKPD